MTAPLVSVIIPTYDRPEAIRRAVNSVSEQTYSPIELIVVDDHSPTPVEDCLSESNLAVSQFRLLRHKDNRGGSTARNTGIKAATGEYLSFLDDDDEWAPDKIQKQVDAFDQAPSDVGLIYTGVKQVDAHGRTNAVVTRAISGDVTEQLLLWNFVGTFSAVMIRHEVIERIGLLDERFPSWQDWEFYLRVSRQYRFGAIPEALVIRHNRGEGQISQNYDRKREVTVPLFESKYLPLADEYGRLHQRKMQAHLAHQLARSAVRVGQYRAAREHVIRAIIQYPFKLPFYIYLGAVSGGKWTYIPLQWLKRTIRHRF